jgi:hypothetical protein
MQRVPVRVEDLAHESRGPHLCAALRPKNADRSILAVAPFKIVNVVADTMPTSMGMDGSQTIGGRPLNFWTPPDVYTVMVRPIRRSWDPGRQGLHAGRELTGTVIIEAAKCSSTMCSNGWPVADT